MMKKMLICLCLLVLCSSIAKAALYPIVNLTKEDIPVFIPFSKGYNIRILYEGQSSGYLYEEGKKSKEMVSIEGLTINEHGKGFLLNIPSNRTLFLDIETNYLDINAAPAIKILDGGIVLNAFYNSKTVKKHRIFQQSTSKGLDIYKSKLKENDLKKIRYNCNAFIVVE